MHSKWSQFIAIETQQTYFSQLNQFLQQESKNHIIYPAHKDVFNAFKYCPLEKIKVVILGQDPYHQPNQAHGISFSVLPEIEPPPSLKNIFKEINSDLKVNHNFSSGCLIDWARQGVLLLNSVLTVRQNQAGSHRNRGWEIFTDRALTTINQLQQPIAYLLWGGFAKSKKSLITNPQHLILETVHPSPLSAYNGFFGCKHFSKVNQFFIDHHLQPINWLF